MSVRPCLTLGHCKGCILLLFVRRRHEVNAYKSLGVRILIWMFKKILVESTTTQNLLCSVFKMASKAGGTVVRLGYSRQAAGPATARGPRRAL
jgi:hypothetical protein